MNEREMQSVLLRFALFVSKVLKLHAKTALQLVTETIYNINICNSYDIYQDISFSHRAIADSG